MKSSSFEPSRIYSSPLSDVTVNEDASDTDIADLDVVFMDIDDELEYSHVVGDTTLVFVAITNNTVMLQFLPDANGSTNIIFTATNPTIRASVSDTITLTILPVNDAPVPGDLVSPIDEHPVTIDSDNLAGETIFEWDPASDVDDLVVTYEWVRKALIGDTEIRTDIIPTNTDTSLSVLHEAIRDTFLIALQTAGASTVTFEWFVLVSDTTVTVSSSDIFTVFFDFDEALLAIDEFTGIPEIFALRQNYPNPFNPVTTIAYDVPEMASVRVDIYNILGQRVRTLINRSHEPGYYRIQWDGTNDYGQVLPSGMYIYSIQASGFTSVKKLVLMK